METSLLQILPNLGVGVVSVLSLGYVALKHSEDSNTRNEQFLNHLDERARRHEEAMKEREQAFRQIEKEVRTQVLDQLSKNTATMERVMLHLDKH